ASAAGQPALRAPRPARVRPLAAGVAGEPARRPDGRPAPGAGGRLLAWYAAAPGRPVGGRRRGLLLPAYVGQPAAHPEDRGRRSEPRAAPARSAARPVGPAAARHLRAV